MKNNNPIQSLWIGTALSPMEIMCIRSYITNGHDFHLYLYDKVLNIPEGTIIKDANEIIPQNEIYVDSFGGYVNFSNIFRYTLLYKLGGWWVDMDTVCLKPFNFDDEFVFSSETSDPYNRCLTNTTYIKSLPGAKFLKDCIDYINNRGHDNIHWGELGVNLISRMIFRNNLGKYIKDPNFFCPISVYQLNILINESDYLLSNTSYAIHWWNEIWRVKKLDKAKTYHSKSFYEILKQKYCVIGKPINKNQETTQNLFQ